MFGRALTESEAEIVERNIRGAHRGEDPLDALDSMPPPRIAAWMRRKAQLADGLFPWAPILGSSCIRRSISELEATHGQWTVRPARNRLDAWSLMEVGLLHEAGGCGVTEIARWVGCSGSTAGLRLQQHRQALLSDDAYASRIEETLRALPGAAYPHGVPT